MFIILLTFSENRSKASEFMPDHNEWIKQGFEEEIFLLVGSLQPGLGGGIIAHNTTREALEKRVNEDPFVSENIVKAEILEITPARAEERLQFLLP